ncbi:hypothetical protein RB199_06255 [Streptomyces libani]
MLQTVTAPPVDIPCWAGELSPPTSRRRIPMDILTHLLANILHFVGWLV